MLQISHKVAEIEASSLEALSEALLTSTTPVVIRGLVAHWPLVQASQRSVAEADAYLRGFYNGRPVHRMSAEAQHNGRFFYNEDLSGFNFTRANQPLTQVLDDLLSFQHDSDSPSCYVGSTAVDSILPGFRAQNDLAELSHAPLVSIWIGNQSRIAAHYDAPDNLACVAAGKRRFTLFPPEQLENLYVGPLDFTPAGQPASLVDFHAPDFERYPRFATALKHASVAELEAGDALFLPSMWWHHVEGLTDLNILINYWWRQVPHHIGAPFDALYHAILSIKDLPEAQRQAWRNVFDHYVFSPTAQEHIPPERRSVLDAIDENKARQLRAMLVNALNR